MDDYLEVIFNIFEHTDQHTKILKTLTIETLIGEILKEFNDIPDDLPEKYGLFIKGSENPLPRKLTIAQLDIQPQDELVLDYLHKTIREMLAPDQYAFIQVDTTGKRYTIKWQPAIIGRPSIDVNHNIRLAVNMQTVPNGLTVSRSQAQITFSEGHYLIERLAEKNPIYLNGKELHQTSKKEIKHADKLMVGPKKIGLAFSHKMYSSHKLLNPDLKYFCRIRPWGNLLRLYLNLLTRTQGISFLRCEKNIACRLIVEKSNIPEHIGQRQEISTYPFTIGRELPILLDEANVSRVHAKLTLDKPTKKFYITRSSQH